MQRLIRLKKEMPVISLSGAGEKSFETVLFLLRYCLEEMGRTLPGFTVKSVTGCYLWFVKFQPESLSSRLFASSMSIMGMSSFIS